MADETTGTETGAKAEAEAKSGRTYSEEEFNRHTANLRASEEAKRREVETKLNSLLEAQKTDQEKALDAKARERDEFWAGQLKQKDIDAEIKVQLLAKGIDPDQIHVVKARGEVSEVGDVAAAIEALVKDKPYLVKAAAPRVQGQSGAPTGSGPSEEFGPPWTADKIATVRRMGQYAKYRDSISAGLAADMGALRS